MYFVFALVVLLCAAAGYKASNIAGYSNARYVVQDAYSKTCLGLKHQIRSMRNASERLRESMSFSALTLSEEEQLSFQEQVETLLQKVEASLSFATTHPVAIGKTLWLATAELRAAEELARRSEEELSQADRRMKAYETLIETRFNLVTPARLSERIDTICSAVNELSRPKNSDTAALLLSKASVASSLLEQGHYADADALLTRIESSMVHKHTDFVRYGDGSQLDWDLAMTMEDSRHIAETSKSKREIEAYIENFW